MAIFILFVLLIILSIYSYNTRQKLINVANVIDQVHAVIDEAFIDDRERIEALEGTLSQIRRAAIKKRRPGV